MSFQRTYDEAKTQRIARYSVQNMTTYLCNEVPALLSGSEPRRQYKEITDPPKWVVDRVLEGYYKEAPHLIGQLPQKWCQKLTRITLSDSLVSVQVSLPELDVPNGLYPSIQDAFTKEELKSLGLHSEKEGEYVDLRKEMERLTNFVSSFERCVPIVLLQRYPWILDRFPRQLINKITDGYTDKILNNYRAEFDALPPRKDRKPTPDESMETALQFLDMIRLQEH